MADDKAQWVPGWNEASPEQGDLLLAFTGNSILKPADSWFLRWGGGPEMGGSRPEALSLGAWEGGALCMSPCCRTPVCRACKPCPCVRLCCLRPGGAGGSAQYRLSGLAVVAGPSLLRPLWREKRSPSPPRTGALVQPVRHPPLVPAYCPPLHHYRYQAGGRPLPAGKILTGYPQLLQSDRWFCGAGRKSGAGGGPGGDGGNRFGGDQHSLSGGVAALAISSPVDAGLLCRLRERRIAVAGRRTGGCWLVYGG